MLAELRLQLLRHSARLSELTKPPATLGGDKESSTYGTIQGPGTARRLSVDQAASLVARYQAGSTVRQLAASFQIHRTTVLIHLERAGVNRRANLRKVTDDQVREAATQYAAGLSLNSVAKAFGVNPTTVTTEFRKVGVPIRPRRGWPSSADM